MAAPLCTGPQVYGKVTKLARSDARATVAAIKAGVVYADGSGTPLASSLPTGAVPMRREHHAATDPQQLDAVCAAVVVELAAGTGLGRALMVDGWVDSAHRTIERVLAGEATARRAVAQTGAWLGRGLAPLSAVLDPGRFIIGRGVTSASELLLAPAREEPIRRTTPVG